MSHLDNYIMQRNFMAGIVGGRMYDANSLSEIDIDCLLQDIDNDLSPENLTCDGELRGGGLAKKTAMLRGAMKELIAMNRKAA